MDFPDIPDQEIPDISDILDEKIPDQEPFPDISNTSEIPTTSSAQRDELKHQKLRDLYSHLGVKNGDTNLASIERFRIRLINDSQTVFEFLKNNGEWVNLTDKRSGKWLTDATLKTKLGGENGMLQVLGVEGLPERFKRQKTLARKLLPNIPTDLEMESIPMQDLGRTASDVDSELRRSFDELPMRELLGLDRALQRIQGELANNVAKLGQLDTHIDHENKKLETMKTVANYTEEQVKEVKKRLSDLQDERGVRLELASQNKQELRGQFARIRQTLEKIIDSDTKLGEKIKTLFREQGVTITAILTAFGLVISTIVGFVTGGGGGSYSPGKPPSDEKGVKKWIQKQLKAIARLLGKLASKLGAALPGILGSIASWLLNIAKNIVSAFAEHTWLLIVFIVGAIATRLMSTKVKAK